MRYCNCFIWKPIYDWFWPNSPIIYYSHHQPLYLCIKYCGIPSCLGTSSFSVCKNRDTQEIEPTKKAKGSQWFEINLEGEFSIVHLYFNFLWNNHKGQLFWEGNRNLAQLSSLVKSKPWGRLCSSHKSWILRFIYSEKATKFCEILP